MFEVAYETTFCATHRLSEGGRPIEPLHGHDWRVEVVAAGEELDRIGVVVDFEQLKQVLGEAISRFHYKDINEHAAFAGRSPSAEAVARYVFDEVRKGMGAEGKFLRRALRPPIELLARRVRLQAVVGSDRKEHQSRRRAPSGTSDHRPSAVPPTIASRPPSTAHELRKPVAGR